MKVALICPDTSRTFRLQRFPVVLGSDEEADVRLDDPTVAPYQCMLDRIGDTLVLWNLGAGRGTLVNGVRVTKTSLTPGDLVTVGRTDVVVLFDHAVRPQVVRLRDRESEAEHRTRTKQEATGEELCGEVSGPVKR